METNHLWEKVDDEIYEWNLTDHVWQCIEEMIIREHSVTTCCLTVKRKFNFFKECTKLIQWNKQHHASQLKRLPQTRFYFVRNSGEMSTPSRFQTRNELVFFHLCAWLWISFVPMFSTFPASVDSVLSLIVFLYHLRLLLSSKNLRYFQMNRLKSSFYSSNPSSTCFLCFVLSSTPSKGERNQMKNISFRRFCNIRPSRETGVFWRSATLCLKKWKTLIVSWHFYLNTI